MTRSHSKGVACGEHCDESFVSNYNRKRHLENLETFTCTLCGKKIKMVEGVGKTYEKNAY